jgi:hypothetical protein
MFLAGLPVLVDMLARVKGDPHKNQKTGIKGDQLAQKEPFSCDANMLQRISLKKYGPSVNSQHVGCKRGAKPVGNQSQQRSQCFMAWDPKGHRFIFSLLLSLKAYFAKSMSTSKTHMGVI